MLNVLPVRQPGLTSEEMLLAGTVLSTPFKVARLLRMCCKTAVVLGYFRFTLLTCTALSVQTVTHFNFSGVVCRSKYYRKNAEKLET